MVNGVKITRQDLSPETRARVEELQRQVIDARQHELDLQIDSILLESEAKKRGVTPSQVIKDEVIAKVPSPTEAEAQDATVAFAEQLRRASTIQINLTAPESPTFSIATDDQPR